jgi:hypothetical protein
LQRGPEWRSLEPHLFLHWRTESNIRYCPARKGNFISRIELQYQVALDFSVIAPIVHFIHKRLNGPLQRQGGVLLAGHVSEMIFLTREEDMRKLMTLTLALATLGFVGVGAETKAKAATRANPQVQIQIGRRHRDRDYRRYRDRDMRVWNTTEVRVVHEGWRTYRETYQVRHFADGRTQMVLINRERVNY